MDKLTNVDVARGMNPIMNASDIELAVARHFNFRTNIIVPNVFWGIYGLQYEADVVVLRQSGFAAEIEIKTNKADIERDLHKRHQHRSRLFRELWFAVPDHLAHDKNIPELAGILKVKEVEGFYKISKERHAKINKAAIRWPDESRNKLLHLGVMRIWGLKTNLMAQKQRLKNRSISGN